jgi:hypothetical protein
MGVTVRLLIRKNGPAGLLVEVEKVEARMAWTVYHFVLTLEDEVPRQEAYAGIEMILLCQEKVQYVRRRRDVCKFSRGPLRTTSNSRCGHSPSELQLFRPLPMPLLCNYN